MNQIPENTLEAAKFVAQLFGDEETSKALEDGRYFRWNPQPDISTSELASCLFLVPLVITGQHMELQQRVYDALPSASKRHFIVKKI